MANTYTKPFFLPKCFDGQGDHFGTSFLLRFLFVSLSLGALSARRNDGVFESLGYQKVTLQLEIR